MTTNSFPVIHGASRRRKMRSSNRRNLAEQKCTLPQICKPQIRDATIIKNSMKNRSRRSSRFMTLRAHRERLSKTTEDTLKTVLSTHNYDEAPLSDEEGDSTLNAISSFSRHHDLSQNIAYTAAASACYPHQSTLLAGWEEGPMLSVRDIYSDGTEISVPTTDLSKVLSTTIEFTSLSSLEAARRVANDIPFQRCNAQCIGVLNAVSPRKPGGASQNGGVTLEECLIRQTTLFDSLQNSSAGQQFYAEHRLSKADGTGLRDHALLYSPNVVVIKDDQGKYIAPYEINVVSAVPLHAESVRAKSTASDVDVLALIRATMRERMARILRLFEERGVRTLILCAFGVGQFCISPDMVGGLWAELLSTNGAKFRDRFDKVVFAVPGKHRDVFERSFYATVLESELVTED